MSNPSTKDCKVTVREYKENVVRYSQVWNATVTLNMIVAHVWRTELVQKWHVVTRQDQPDLLLTAAVSPQNVSSTDLNIVFKIQTYSLTILEMEKQTHKQTKKKTSFSFESEPASDLVIVGFSWNICEWLRKLLGRSGRVIHRIDSAAAFLVFSAPQLTELACNTTGKTSSTLASSYCVWESLRHIKVFLYRSPFVSSCGCVYV